jgi:hypothetical protein
VSQIYGHAYVNETYGNVHTVYVWHGILFCQIGVFRMQRREDHMSELCILVRIIPFLSCLYQLLASKVHYDQELNRLNIYDLASMAYDKIKIRTFNEPIKSSPHRLSYYWNMTVHTFYSQYRLYFTYFNCTFCKYVTLTEVYLGKIHLRALPQFRTFMGLKLIINNSPVSL